MNSGKICVSVCTETVEEMIAKIKRAEEFADVIEVRFDCLTETGFNLTGSDWIAAWTRIVNATQKDTISTLRPFEQGGRRRLSLEERHAFWNSGCQTDICDIEDTDMIEQGEWTCGKRIVSYHDFAGVPDDLDSIYCRLETADANVIKIAAAAGDISDAIPMWRLIDRAKLTGKQIIPIAMGEAGKWTRILGLAHGSYLTYASLDDGMGTAAGQITVQDLIEIYRVKELDLDTEVFGVIGNPVSESLSPYLHNPAFVANNVNAVFIPLQVKDLDEFMRRMVRPETREVELNFSGFSVTMPHKRSIMKHLDAIDPTAEKIGAVNTVKVNGDKLIGYNTDAQGFITPLKERCGDINGAQVAVFGAGGAARACVFALTQEKANVTVFARDIKRGKQIVDEFGVRFAQINTDGRQLTTDILVNATPLGMKGDLENESLFTFDQLEGVKFIYDLVTRAEETPLIREARKAGIAAIGGLEMLICQGAKQFEIWTGQTAPIEKMRAAVLNRIQQRQNER